MSGGRTLVGQAVSPGIAIGPPVVVENRPLPVTREQIDPERIADEVARLRGAAVRAGKQLGDLAEQARVRVGQEYAAIFEAHRLMLADPALLDEVEAVIRNEAVNSEWAPEQVIHRLLGQFERPRTRCTRGDRDLRGMPRAARGHRHRSRPHRAARRYARVVAAARRPVPPRRAAARRGLQPRLVPADSHARRGCDLSDCHEPHGGKLRAPGNEVCAQCHAPAKFDTGAHHLHAAGSAGAQCAACHMPVRTYMVVDPRHDHSLRVPRPDLTLKLGLPNACGACHKDKDARWAAEVIAKVHGPAPKGFQTYAEALHAARAGSVGAHVMLLALARERPRAELVGASWTLCFR